MKERFKVYDMEGVERLKKMLGVNFQKPLFKIFMYLKTREDMDEKYLNPEKNFIQMYEYIKSEAKKQAKNGVAVLDDQAVYSLAIHYFDESNEDLGLNKKFEKLQSPLKQEQKNTMVATKTNEVENDNQISFFAEGGIA